jgi:hypothetical protein
MGCDEQTGDLLSEVQVEAEGDRSLGLRSEAGWMRNDLEYLRYAGRLPDVQLELDHYPMFFLQTVLPA